MCILVNLRPTKSTKTRVTKSLNIKSNERNDTGNNVVKYFYVSDSLRCVVWE